MRARSRFRRQCLTPARRSMPKRCAAVTQPKIPRWSVRYWKKWRALNEQRGAPRRRERQTAGIKAAARQVLCDRSFECHRSRAKRAWRRSLATAAVLSSENRDGMRIDWNVPIAMDDGVVLRADVFRPVAEGRYPVILSYGPYAKGLAFQDGYPSAWQRMAERHPDVTAGSSNLYQSWEVVDPEKWVPHDYACVRVDSRGCGCSPGFIDHFSPRETKDFYDCIEWAAAQPWSSGKVGLNGISYYAINQWHVASLQPPHLAAMCIWEGAADWYRDMTHHGGIVCTFWENWYDMQVKTVQYGAGERGKRSRVH